MAAARAALAHLSPWTPEYCALLRELWDVRQWTAGQIGLELGVTRNAVIGKVHRMRLSVRGRIPPPKQYQWTRVNYPKRRAPVPQEPPQQPPPKPEPVEEIPPEGVLLVDLQPWHCRWPLGEPSEMRFCGQRQAGKGSYCPVHMKRAYQKGK